jgi:hypothetical protein
LESFILHTQLDPSQRDIEAKACKQLGVLFSKQRQYDASVTYFEKHFNLITKKAGRTSSLTTPIQSHIKYMSSKMKPESSNNLPETEEFRLASVQLGIAKANSQMNFLFDTVSDIKGVSALIDWKNTRSFGTYLPPSHRVVRID